MEGITTEPLFEEEPKVPVPGKEEVPVPNVEPLRFSLILESRHRELLKREFLARKKGHNRKLAKKDHDKIDEQLRLFHFDPAAFIDRHIGHLMPKNVMEEINQENVPDEESDVKVETNEVNTV